MIKQEVVSVTTTGSAGSATGTADTGLIHGHILSIHFNFHASAPATTDTTVAYKGGQGNIVVVSNSATDVLIHPRAKPVDNANAAITNAHAPFPCSQALTVSLAQCDALTDAVTATIWYDS